LGRLFLNKDAALTKDSYVNLTEYSIVMLLDKEHLEFPRYDGSLLSEIQILHERKAKVALKAELRNLPLMEDDTHAHPSGLAAMQN
jgi:hypothetical protein